MHNQLTELAGQIRDWQTKRRLSDADLCKKFLGLGSTKTFKRILDGNTGELDVERWLLDYQQVWNLMELADHEADIDEPVYDDLAHIVRARLAVTGAIKERGNNRFVLIEGPSGSGKTTASRSIAAHFGRQIVLTEADPTWDSRSVMLGGLLRSMGVVEIPISAEARKLKLLDHLKESPVCLIIDEAHHLGPDTLNLLKTLINQTKCQIVCIAIGTLFRKLETKNYEEARQLTRNRQKERLTLKAPDEAQVQSFISRRLTFSDATTLRLCASTLSERAASYGHWNFVNLVCREAKERAGRDAIDIETFGRALQSAAATR